MATEAKSVLPVEGGCFVITWSGLGVGDDGDPAQFGGAPDRSIQVYGTFGGASLILQGRNSAAAPWFTLTNPLGGDLIFTAAGGKAVCELTRHVRPFVSGGDGSTDLIAELDLRSSK
jgi:hypothetical protein